MSILGELGLSIAALATLAFTRRAGIGDAAPNPATAVARIEPEIDMDRLKRAIVPPFAPKRPAASLDDMMADIDDTEADLERAIITVERLIEQKRTQIAAMRTRLDAEDAKLDQEAAENAARKAEVLRLRTALPAVAEAVEEVQEEPQS